MIIGFIGTMGQGKTVSSVFMTRLILEKTGVNHVVSNFSTEYTDTYVSTPRELEQVSQDLKKQGKTSIYNLDEVWAWMDARESMQNTTMTDFVINSRKRLGIILWTSQDISQPDKRLRNNTDYIGVCRHFDGEYKGLNHDIQHVYVFKRTEAGEYIHATTFKYNPNPFYGLYNTQEEIKGEKKAKSYEDLIEEYKREVSSGNIQYKNELKSILHMEEGLSKSDAEDLTNLVFSKLDRGKSGKTRQKTL